MAEDNPRSFDLKSWQGLTEVLKYARESNLTPDEYASFRNLVLTYAQEKGADPALKKKIDTLILSFGTKRESAAEEKSNGKRASGSTEDVKKSGRRIIPSFMPTFSKVDALEGEKGMPPKSVPIAPAQQTIPEQVAVTPPPPTTPEVVVPLRSPQEHRERIMEIKRHVISLVGNPISLVDHGNTIGRDYMMALLNALKATSPGTTLNIEDSMRTLETAYESILAYQRRPKDEKETVVSLQPDMPVEAPLPQSPIETLSTPVSSPLPPETPHDDVLVGTPQEEAGTMRGDDGWDPTPTVEDSMLLSKDEPVTPLALNNDEEPLQPPAPPVTVTKKQPPQNEKEEEPAIDIPQTRMQDEAHHVVREEGVDIRWTEEGGDTDVEEQIKELRKQLDEIKPQAPKSLRVLDGIPKERDATARLLPKDEPRGPHIIEDEPMPQDAFEAVRKSAEPLGSFGTPQGDLMSPEVTMALTELLHEWKIFASSGLFGLGPGGMEHPLYVHIASLPMGEVIAGRFEGVDMKIVHTIKDYVNAWRHEQGIAYNPSETFEHYLRRVAQRILRRQQGIRD